MTAPEPSVDAPVGTVRQHPDTLQTAVRTRWAEPTRAWLIVDLVHGGAYSDGAECVDWPMLGGGA